jgi:hypothetical protein
MRSRILIGLALIATLAEASDIGAVSVSGGATGTRIRFTTGTELLSRVATTPTGIRIELLGASSDLKGVYTLAGNPLFQEVRCTPVHTAQARLTRFEFELRQGVKVPSILHREWNGRELDFVLDRKAVAKPFVARWNAPEVSANVAVLASLETAANLMDAKISAQGDLETIHLHFNQAPAMAVLSGEGKSFEIALGKSRASTSFKGVGGEGLLAKSIRAGKKAGGTVLSIEFSEAPKSVLLSRVGSVVQLRVVRSTPLEGVVVWNSGTGKSQQLIKSSLPNDELASISSVSKGGSTGGSVFTPEGSQAAFHAQADASQAGVSMSGGNATESERLEAERRKSREFLQEQEREIGAKLSAEATKNRVVYNTFGIRDPFIPLEPDDIEGGLNIDQMRVVGIIYSPSRAMAVLEHTTQTGLSVALREGDAIQNGRVLQIQRDKVVFVLEEFGVTRQFTLKLQVPKGEKS